MIIVFVFGIPYANALEEELVTIPTRPGVTQSFLLIKPDHSPVASVILFAGAHGRLELSKQGVGWGKNNFLVRNRERFAREGFMIAVIDSPSDRPKGLWNFRTSKEHAEDIKHVILTLKKMVDVPVWLVGTSMGSVSAANAAARLKDGGPDGIVLTSSITKESRQVSETVNSVRLKDIRVPTLIVHHKGDGCVVSPYGNAMDLMKRLKQVTRCDLITFDGGDPSVSDPCEAMSYHGFLGLDADVIATIASWIKAAQS